MARTIRELILTREFEFKDEYKDMWTIIVWQICQEFQINGHATFEVLNGPIVRFDFNKDCIGTFEPGSVPMFDRFIVNYKDRPAKRSPFCFQRHDFKDIRIFIHNSDTKDFLIGILTGRGYLNMVVCKEVVDK